MAVTTSGECGTWARNIDPNLPAPIRPTRTGRPAARRSTASRCRFIGAATSSVRQSSANASIGVKSRWAIHSARLNWRMWLSTRHSERYTITRPNGLMFGGLACTRQPWKISIEPGGPDRGHDAAPLGQLGDRRPIQRPQRIGGGGQVVPRLVHALAVAAGDEQQRPVGRAHLVEEHRDVHGQRLGHGVVALPGAVVLVPLPHLAVEGGLGVDLVLVHVDRAAEHLLDRPDQAGMAAQPAERLRVGVRGEGGARRTAALPPHLLAVHGVDRVRLGAQHRRLCRGEHLGQEQVAVPVELGRADRR